MTSRALVLGGGGLAGIAWETGVLHGLADAGLDVIDADLLVGTSAGANVAAQLGGPHALAELYHRQEDPSAQIHELAPTAMTQAQLWEAMGRLLEDYPDPAERRRQVGAFARAAATGPEAARREVIAGRLDGATWPARPLVVVVADAETGERRTLDRASGVDLVDAVAASSAVPGIWPTVTIDGARYMDGGMYSTTNADLAHGHDVVLVVAPRTTAELDEEIALLDATARTAIVLPDDDARQAFGVDPLDPAVRAPAARAGFVQGQSLASSLSALWNS
jgi:NTE family protein